MAQKSCREFGCSKSPVQGTEALKLIPPPLPRVKFLLMDSRGSPQAQTRWSDPIALHQGSAGEGPLWL